MVRYWKYHYFRMATKIFLWAMVLLFISWILFKLNYEYLCSICSNVFAGLFTGLVLCLVGGSKQKELKDLQIRLEWLIGISTELKLVMEEYYRLQRIHFDRFNGDRNLYSYFYDLDTRIKDIHNEVTNNRQNNGFGQSAILFCSEQLGYNPEEMEKKLKDLHCFVEHIDIDCPSSNDIYNKFKEVHIPLRAFRHEVVKCITLTKEELSEIERSII